MSYQIGVDIGGTFTDLAIYDEKEGAVKMFKAPSRPDAPSKGVFDVLELAAIELGISLRDLLSNTEVFVHGSIIGTNAVIQHTAAKVGLICTKGFRDVLYFREGHKPGPYNLKMAYPQPYVPRYLTLPVTERINSQGEVVEPLSEDEVRQAIGKFRECGVEAIAVCLLWSVANPVHERRVAEIIKEEWPEMAVSISSEVQPAIREWQRTSATVLDASIKPLVGEYVADLQQSLNNSGFKHDYYMVVAT
jgi:N-methylhydantoinase A